MPRLLSSSLTDHALEWRELPWPLPWETIFGRKAPLALEIGFGNGAFMEEQCLAHPERDHIAVEVSWTAATHLFRRAHRNGITNLRVIVAEAEVVVGLLFAPDSIAEVFVNHPCPWHKARHEDRRLIRKEFLELLADRMQTGAHFLLVTDHDGYAAWATDALEGQKALVSRHATTEIDAIPGRTATKYEKKALDRGESIHYFQWIKQNEPIRVPIQPEHDSHLPPVGSESDDPEAMPTVVLSGGPADDVLFTSHEPIVHQEDHGGVHTVVKLGPVYKEMGRPVWLVETLVQEDRLRQDFTIQTVRLQSGELLVKFASAGRPHPTFGSKRAVWLLSQRLREQHADLKLVRQTVGETVATGAS